MPHDDPHTSAIWSALATVIDPELGLDVVTLGLVYDVEIDAGTARIRHTLTTPGCPMEGIITEGIRAAVLRVDGVTDVETTSCGIQPGIRGWSHRRPFRCELARTSSRAHF